jgi:hypothetical protein
LVSWFSFNEPNTPFAIDNCGNYITGFVTQPAGGPIAITPYQTTGISGLAINLGASNPTTNTHDRQSLEIFGYPSKFTINISKPFTISFWFSANELGTTLYRYQNTRNTNSFEISTSRESGNIIVRYRDAYNVSGNNM